MQRGHSFLYLLNVNESRSQFQACQRQVRAALFYRGSGSREEHRRGLFQNNDSRNLLKMLRKGGEGGCNLAVKGTGSGRLGGEHLLVDLGHVA